MVHHVAPIRRRKCSGLVAQALARQNDALGIDAKLVRALLLERILGGYEPPPRVRLFASLDTEVNNKYLVMCICIMSSMAAL